MINKHLNGMALVAALVAPVALPTGSAEATPGSGFAPSPIVVGHYGSLDVKTESDKVGHWGMVLKTKDDTDVDADRLTVAPSGVSGWHSHPGPVFVTVTQGSVVWYDGSDPACPSYTYHAGQSFIENAARIHNVKNASASAGAEFIAIHLNPAGTSGPVFRIDESKPTNCR
jgi:quercetin dioxygenase-like cupin family protein